MSQTVGTAAVHVTRYSFNSSKTEAPSSFPPGMIMLAPAIGVESASDQPLACNIGEDHVAIDGRKTRGEFFQKRHEGQIGHHHAILGVIDDPGDLVGEEPWIDRVVDGADADDAVPGFEMPPRIPGERRHTIAG